MMDSKGILIVVSGFSGAGKGTLMKELLKNHPGQYTLSISATTRQPRDGEEDGREYFFITTEEFEKMIAQDQLIEYARYVNIPLESIRFEHVDFGWGDKRCLRDFSYTFLSGRSYLIQAPSGFGKTTLLDRKSVV